MDTVLPNVTVCFNLLSCTLLIGGYRAIRRRAIAVHKRWMLAALCSSAGFLTSYLTHHYLHGSTPYPFQDWTRPVYFIVLIPHVILAVVVTPFILTGVWLAWRERFTVHARLMRWVFPVWLYVSITGVIVYVMLYLQPHWRGVQEDWKLGRAVPGMNPQIDEQVLIKAG